VGWLQSGTPLLGPLLEEALSDAPAGSFVQAETSAGHHLIHVLDKR
jgi:hypothetical protein